MLFRSKSVIIQFGNVDFDYSIHLGGERVPCLEQAPDLGVIVDKQLTFRPHLRKIKKKAAISCHMFKDTFRSRDLEVMKAYHRTHYKPVLTYASQVWMKYDKVTFDMLNAMDRRFWKISPAQRGT